MYSGRHVAGMLRALALGLMVLGAGSALYAVPKINLTGGGGHTTDISLSNPDCAAVAGNIVCLFNQSDVAALDSNGLGSLGVKNDSGQTITDLSFYLPTNNFNQNFVASTNLFTNASLNFTPPAGIDGYTIADFFGTGTTQVNGGMASANPCTTYLAAFLPCPTNGPQGFDVQSLKENPTEGFLVAKMGTVNAGQFGGLVDCSVSATACEATLGLVGPEPGMFVLLLGAMGVMMVVRRKIHQG